MSIAALTAILPRPSEVPKVGADDWLKAEAHLGVALPADYKSFIEIYGPGRVIDFFWIYSPFTYNPYINLCSQADVARETYRMLAEGGEDCRYPVFPEPGGLLPFGRTDNGDMMFWLTSGPPDDWPVVLNEARGPDYDYHPCAMTTFLGEIITCRRRSSIFPDDLLPADLSFETLSAITARIEGSSPRSPGGMNDA